MYVQIGLSETSVLKDYHKDALDRHNVTCDFPKVIRELVDPHKRFPFQVNHCICPLNASSHSLTLKQPMVIICLERASAAPALGHR